MSCQTPKRDTVKPPVLAYLQPYLKKDQEVTCGNCFVGGGCDIHDTDRDTKEQPDCQDCMRGWSCSMHDVKKEVEEGDCQGCCQGLCDIHGARPKTLSERKAKTQIKQEPQNYKQLRCGNCTAQLTCWISENQPKQSQDPANPGYNPYFVNSPTITFNSCNWTDCEQKK